MAQKPIAIAAVVRTNSARDMLNLRRIRSVSWSARRMIPICSLLGGGGKYSSFDAGRTSTGRSSGSSCQECRWGPDVIEGPDRFQLITASPRVGAGGHLVTVNAPRMKGWMRQK